MTENKRNQNIFPHREQTNNIPANKEEQYNNLTKKDVKVELAEGQTLQRQKTQALLILQKAQIQRLTESMNDYKCKLRNLNIENLDRKSYQTQIGQLFQSNNRNKFEIQKLNTSIKNLVSSNQKYRKQLSLANQKIFQLENNKRQLHQKYQVLKFQNDIISQDFKVYKKETDENMQKTQKQLLMHKGYGDSLKANNQDLLKRVSTIPNYQSKIFQLEKALSLYKNQNQLLKDEMGRYKEKIANVERNHSILYQNNVKLQKQHKKLKQLHEQFQIKQANLNNQNIKSTQPLKNQQQDTSSAKDLKKIAFLKEQVKEQNLRNQKTLTTCKALTDINNKLREQKRAHQIELQNLKVVLSDYEKKLNDSLNKHSIFIHQSNKHQAQLEKRLAENDKNMATLAAQKQRLSKQIMTHSKLISNKVSQCEYLKRRLIEVEDDLREQFQNNFQQQKKAFNYTIELQKKASQQCIEQMNNSISAKKLVAGTKQYQTSKQIEILKQEIKDKNSQIENLRQERHQISLLLGHKTTQNQKLKLKFFTLEQEFKAEIEKTAEKIKQNYQKKIQQIKSQDRQKQALKSKQNILLAQAPDEPQLQSSKYKNDIKKLTAQKDNLSKEVGELKNLIRQNDLTMTQSWKEIRKLHDLLETNQLKYKTKIEVYFRNNLGLEENLCKTQKSLANKQIMYEESLKLIQQLQEHNASNKAIYSKLQSQFISIQLLTGQLKQERDLLMKKNASLIKGIQHLNHEIKLIHEGAEKISMFFTKDSSVHETLEKHYTTVQEIFNSIQKLKSGSGDENAHNLETTSNF